ARKSLVELLGRAAAWYLRSRLSARRSSRSEKNDTLRKTNDSGSPRLLTKSTSRLACCQASVLGELLAGFACVSFSAASFASLLGSLFSAECDKSKRGMSVKGSGLASPGRGSSWPRAAPDRQNAAKIDRYKNERIRFDIRKLQPLPGVSQNPRQREDN